MKVGLFFLTSLQSQYFTGGLETHLIGANIHSEASTEQNHLSADAIQYKPIENQAHYQKSQHGVQLSTGPSVGETLVQNAMSNTSFLTNRPQEKSGITEGSLSQARLTLSSKEAPVSPHSKPVHQPVEAFNTAAMAEQSALGETVSQLGMQMSGYVTGLVAKKALTQQGVQTLRTALHAGVAGVSAAMSGQSVGGAVAGVVAGDLATAPLAEVINTSELGKAMSNLARNAVAGIAGAAAGAAAGAVCGGGKAGAALNSAFSGVNQALMADAWNRQLHAKESQTLAELMQEKSPEEQKRLVEAAASLTKASAGVPDNDPKKASLSPWKPEEKRTRLSSSTCEKPVYTSIR